MSSVERQQQIRSRVDELSVSEPSTEAEQPFWMPLRGNPNCYRLVADGESQYDVYCETDISRDKAGFLNITVKVVLYNVQDFCYVAEETMLDKTFAGRQPREQAFLLNYPNYQQQVQDKFDEYVDWAEELVEDDLIGAENTE